MELICGACHGRLLVEMPGTTVACPHCGTHLQTPAAEALPQPQTPVLIDVADGPASGPDPSRDTIQMDAWAQLAAAQSAAVAPEPFVAATVDSPVAAHVADAVVAAPASTPVGPSSPEALVASAAPARADSPVDDPLLAVQAAFRAAETIPPPVPDHSDARQSSETAFSNGEDAHNQHKTTEDAFPAVVGFENSITPAATREIGTAEPPAPSSATAAEIVSSSPPIESAGVSDAAAVPIGLHEQSAGKETKDQPPRTTTRAGISPTVFMIVLSYASAMTLACLYLAFQLLSNPRTHDLPDLAPPKPKDKKKVTTLIYLSPDQELPPANVLKLGETRQFGSLKVTPLRVTRGLLEFDYYEPEANQHKDPEGPVLKLHLRFENVSRDQEFVPLDSTLVFYKEVDKKTYGLFKANDFVCKVADRKNLSKQVLTFDLTPDGNWLLKGENLDREFGPGQVLDTFIPSAPDQIETLSGDLVWRVHFRKGYNPTSYRGVTTLIEVFFNDSDIIEEPPPAPAAEEPDAPASDAPAKETPATKDA